MTTISKIKLIITILIINFTLLPTHYLKAQQTNYNEVVKIVGDYTPTISDAFKINLNPKLQDSVIKVPSLNYSIQSAKINSNFVVEPIKPAKLIGEPLDPLYNSFFEAGFGNYTTPYAEFFYNTLRSKDYSAGFHLKHISSNAEDGRLVTNTNSNYSDNEIDLYGKYFKDENILFGDFNFSRNVYHYYGISPNNETPVKNDSLKQIFSYFSFDAGIMSNNTYPHSMEHSLLVKFYSLADNYSASENNININGSLSKNISFINSAKSQKLILEADGDFYFDKNNDLFTAQQETNNGVIKIVPELANDFGLLKLNIGANFSFFKSITKIYPIVDADLNLINEILYAYAGIKGEAERNNLKQFSDENPFINTTLNSLLPTPYAFSSDNLEFFGGIKGSFSKYINYDISVSALSMENLPLFVTDTTKGQNKAMENKFDVIYDNAKQIIRLKGEVSYQQTDKLGIVLKAEYNSYTMSNQLKAWEMPGFDINLTANYKLNDRITLRCAFIGLYQVYARTFNNKNEVVADKLNNIYDINLGVNYKFTKQISGFLNLNNIGNYQYDRWYNYPSQRVNFIIGASCSF